MKIRSADGAVHFTALKAMARSPMHYVAACSGGQRKSAFRGGSIVHEMVLGPRNDTPLAVFKGRRAGKDWETFLAAHAGQEIVTASEWDKARPVAEAVLNSEPAMALIRGARYEVPMRWDDAGIECATDGVDILGADYLADLKTSKSSKPDEFCRMGANYGYHAQLDFYRSGAIALGHLSASSRALVIAVESSAPYAVTVFEVGKDALEAGRRSLTLWLERLRACEENDFWPGYAQGVVPFELPPWLSGPDEEEDDSDEAA